MDQSTNKDLHYLLTETINSKNGIEWYRIIKAFALGERSNESGLSRQLLDELKLPPSKTVKENIAAFEEAVLRVDNVNLTSMTDSEKLFIMYKKLRENKQEGIQAILYTAKAASRTYRELIDMLVNADPPVIKAQKLNNLVESKQPCRNFQAGKCTWGKECRFSHKIVKTQDNKPQDKKTYDKPRKEKTRYQPPDTKAVTSDHRSRVGDPRGTPSVSNPEGYTKPQRVLLKMLSTMDHDDKWSDPSYFDKGKSNNKSEHLNMFTTNTLKAPVQERRTSPRLVAISDEVSRALALQEDNLRVIHKRVKAFKSDYKFIPTIKDLLLYVHKYAKTDLVLSNNTSEAIIFTGFRWQSSHNPLMNMCKENFQVKDADPRVMKLLYENSNYFNAWSCLPEDGEMSYRDFNLYQPSCLHYFERFVPGSYFSRNSTVEEFYIKGTEINMIREKTDTKNVLMLGLVYDFMSFAAEYLNIAVVSRKTIMAGRTILRNDIRIMNEDPKYSDLFMLTRIFHAIVDSIRPPLVIPDDPPTPEVRTFSVMSAPARPRQEYQDLSGIDTDDDMDLEDAVEIFEQRDIWEDTSEASQSPTEVLKVKDRQRAENTPPIKTKRDRQLRNVYNFPDTPELFTPQPKKLRKAEAKAAQAGKAYASENFDADTFPIHPPRTPDTTSSSKSAKRSNTTTPPLPRSQATPQSSPRRVAVGRLGNGAPIWGWNKKRITRTTQATDPPPRSATSSSAAQVQLHHRLPLSTADQRHAPMSPSPHQHPSVPEADHQSRMVYPMTLQYLQEVTAHQRHPKALTADQRRPLQHPQGIGLIHLTLSPRRHLHMTTADQRHPPTVTAHQRHHPTVKADQRHHLSVPDLFQDASSSHPTHTLSTSPLQQSQDEYFRNFARVPRPNSTSCML